MSAWETVRGDSRESPRHQLRLAASVVLDDEAGLASAFLAQTKDVSRGGLCLIIPALGESSQGLQEGGAALRITLQLPDKKTLELVGTSIYCHPFNAGGPKAEYVLGVKLTDSNDLPLYHEFIASLTRR